MNAYLNLTNINLALKVKNLDPELDLMSYINEKSGYKIFLYLVNFLFLLTTNLALSILLSSLLISLTILFLLIDTRFFTKDFILMVFSIEIMIVAIWLKL